MTCGGGRPRRRPRPITEAVEPESYDRRFYARVLLAGIFVIAIAVGFLVYNFAFKTSRYTPGPTVDLGSLFKASSKALPDPFNPSVVIQEHLEATRRGSYQKAYDYLSTGLKTTVSLGSFIANCKSNSLLFRDISRYSFPGCELNGAAAAAEGRIEYSAGGSSRVEVAFTKEGNAWRISEMNVVFQ